MSTLQTPTALLTHCQARRRGLAQARLIFKVLQVLNGHICHEPFFVGRCIVPGLSEPFEYTVFPLLQKAGEKNTVFQQLLRHVHGPVHFRLP
jgi:hypothetical protein